MTNRFLSRAAAAALLGCCLLGGAFAQEAPAGAASGPRHGDRPHGPPPEAIAACSGKTAGATASFTGRRGDTVTGTCELVNNVLAVRPAGGPPPPPPPKSN